MSMVQQETPKKQAILGYIQDRWQRELEPVLSKATVGQEQELEALWERTLRWLREERGLQGDSLRKPCTQIRILIKQLPLHEGNTCYVHRSRQPQHVAYPIFTLAEEEWTRMNADDQQSLQERLEQQQFLDNERIEAMVNQGLIFIQSNDWAELVVGLALATGRRFWEIVKTGSFVEKTPYSVWFTGQAKGRGREDEQFEIPTLVRAFLVVEGVKRVRRLIAWDELEDEYSPSYQKYNRAVNEVVVRSFTDLIPLRPTRERLSVHVLRAVYARVATYWYAPPTVADITFMAQIQGHRFVLEPDVEPRETPEDIKKKQLSYAASANYFDYKIGRKTPDGSYQLVGDQGIKLGNPGVTVLDAFRKEVLPEGRVVDGETGRKRKGKKPESTSGWAPLTVRRPSRDWFREVGEKAISGSRQSEKDDAFLRQLLTLYIVGGGAEHAGGDVLTLSLDQLDLPEKTRDQLRQAMALSGATDLLAFLLAVAQPQVQQLLSQQSRHHAQAYESLATDALDTRDPAARQELYRRAVYSVMKYNQFHELGERWYLSERAIQSLVGGRKEFIKQYREAHTEEFEAHHREFGIQEGFNRKPGKPQIQVVVNIPNEAAAYPWGRITTINE